MHRRKPQQQQGVGVIHTTTLGWGETAAMLVSFHLFFDVVDDTAPPGGAATADVEEEEDEEEDNCSSTAHVGSSSTDG